MNRSRSVVPFAAGMLLGLSGRDAAGPGHATAVESAVRPEPPRFETKSLKMNVRIGNRTFPATLDDNPAVARLRAMLPMTLAMIELNGNEKYIPLSTRLPTDASSPGTIRAGDLMLWGADTLVLFTKTFPTTHRYTRLGRVDDPSGLPAAVGSGGVTVTFALD